MDLAITETEELKLHTYNPWVTTSLLENEEWDKLGFWMAITWIVWLPEDSEIMKDLKSATISLFYHQPDSIQKLRQWLDEWCIKHYLEVPQPFQQICEQALEGAQ